MDKGGGGNRNGFTHALRAVLALLPCVLFSCGAVAADLSDRLSLNGFYTLDASLSKGADLNYPSKSADVTSILLKDGHINSDFSLIGVQADLSLTDSLHFTAQAISGKQTERNNFDPVLAWVYLSYDFGDDFTLRGGKFQTPLLQGTELKYIGYSRLWVRPLIPSSGAGGFDDYQGIDLIKKGRLGDYDIRLQGGYGVADHVLDTIENKNIKLASMRVGRDNSWVNAAVMHARYDIYTRDRSRFMASGTSLLMGSLETELWFDRVVVNAGLARGVAKVSPDENMRYLSLGYRFDTFTPYVLYHDRTMRFSPSPSVAPRPRPPAPQPPPARSEQKNGTQTTQSLSLGLRYDLGASHAIKAQLERQRHRDDSNPQLGPQQSAATIFSIVIEGTF